MSVTFLQPNEVSALLHDHRHRSKVLILDVRDDDFIGDGHIKGCLNIPSYDLIDANALDKFIDETLLPAGVDTLIVHCYLSQQRGPVAARRIYNRLNERGIEARPQVCVMAHGWRRFRQLYGHTDLCEADRV